MTPRPHPTILAVILDGPKVALYRVQRRKPDALLAMGSLARTIAALRREARRVRGDRP